MLSTSIDFIRSLDLLILLIFDLFIFEIPFSSTVTRRVKETIPSFYTLAVHTQFNPSYELPTDEAYRERGSQCREQPLNLLSPFLSPVYEKIRHTENLLKPISNRAASLYTALITLLDFSSSSRLSYN